MIRLVAALGGLLLFGSLFLPWYDEAQVTPVLPQDETHLIAADLSANAWQYFDVTDIALAAAAAVAVAVPLVPRLAALAAAACAAASALIVYRMFDRPGPFEIEGLEITLALGIGPWLALAGALLAAVSCGVAVRRSGPA